MSGSTTPVSTVAANAFVSQIATLAQQMVLAALTPKLAAMQANIEQALETASQTASQLKPAGEIQGGDGVAIVQDGQDVLATQEQMAEYYVNQALSALQAAVAAALAPPAAAPAPAAPAAAGAGS